MFQSIGKFPLILTPNPNPTHPSITVIGLLTVLFTVNYVSGQCANTIEMVPGNLYPILIPNAVNQICWNFPAIIGYEINLQCSEVELTPSTGCTGQALRLNGIAYCNNFEFFNPHTSGPISVEFTGTKLNCTAYLRSDDCQCGRYFFVSILCDLWLRFLFVINSRTKHRCTIRSRDRLRHQLLQLHPLARAQSVSTERPML